MSLISAFVLTELEPNILIRRFLGARPEYTVERTGTLVGKAVFQKNDLGVHLIPYWD